MSPASLPSFVPANAQRPPARRSGDIRRKHSHKNAFVTPQVANGRVYVGATNTVTVFGLAP